MLNKFLIFIFVSGLALKSQDTITKVAIFFDPSAKGQSLINIENCLSKYPVSAQRISVDEICNNMLTEFDVIIFPGGAATRQGRILGEKGRIKIQEFVKNGGGYLGICAGAFLAGILHDCYLKILNMSTAYPHYRSGVGQVDVKFSQNCKMLLNLEHDCLSLRFFNGPIMVPANVDHLDAYEELGKFDSELNDNDIEHRMKGHTALAVSKYGKGLVMASSCHVERNNPELLYKLVKYVCNPDL